MFQSPLTDNGWREKPAFAYLRDPFPQKNYWRFWAVNLSLLSVTTAHVPDGWANRQWGSQLHNGIIKSHKPAFHRYFNNCYFAKPTLLSTFFVHTRWLSRPTRTRRNFFSLCFPTTPNKSLWFLNDAPSGPREISLIILFHYHVKFPFGSRPNFPLRQIIELLMNQLRNWLTSFLSHSWVHFFSCHSRTVWYAQTTVVQVLRFREEGEKYRDGRKNGVMENRRLMWESKKVRREKVTKYGRERMERYRYRDVRKGNRTQGNDKGAKIGKRNQCEGGKLEGGWKRRMTVWKKGEWSGSWLCVVLGAFVCWKQCWFLWSSVDQEHSSDQADASQPEAEAQLSDVTLYFSQTKHIVMILHAVPNLKYLHQRVCELT